MLDFGFYNMDCEIGMKEFPDNYFDLAIVDPPYGIREHGGKSREGPQSKLKGLKSCSYINKNWDNFIPEKEYFDELFRVSKNQIIWGGNYFITFLKPTPCFIVWDKKTNDGSDFADCEIAWTSFTSAIRKFKYDWVGFGYINNPQKEKKIHPTQKPVALYEWLLRKYATKGDKIIDTHVGSASSLVACYNLDFDVVGFEKDKDYFNDATARLEKVKAQVKLSDLLQVNYGSQ